MWALVEKIIRKRIILDPKLAMVSFTFDDAPLSSFINGGTILEENGFRGTYYVSSKLMGESNEIGLLADLDIITEFHSRGHEIANHTNSHFNCQDINPITMAWSILDNRKQLHDVMSKNFSYPYGSKNASSLCVARLCTSSARGIGFDINRGMINPMNLEAVRVNSRLGIQKCLDLVSECATRGGWLIFYTHDVCDEPSDYGCTPDQLTELVRAAYREKLPVLTVQNAMRTIQNA